jgi:hypothetical protein
MNRKLKELSLNASRDPVSIETLMKMPPGIYIGSTYDGKRAVIKVGERDPIVNIQVSLGGAKVQVTEHYSDGSIREYDKDMII